MVLAVLFFIVAMLYSSVGFGGGSSYIALLVLGGVSYTLIPVIALVCNVIVVLGNSFHYMRFGYLKWRLLLPPVVFSVPCAFLGGSIVVDKDVFVVLLFVFLLVTGVQLLIKYREYDEGRLKIRELPILWGASIGAGLGFMAGLVGIGGGIFLAPILYHLRAGAPKQIAATASVFILLNSLSGLVGQLSKGGVVQGVFEYWYLPLVVLLGGQIGNFVTLRIIPARIVALGTSLLVLFVCGRLGVVLFSM